MALERTHLLVVVLAVAGAGAGLLAGRLLQPEASRASAMNAAPAAIVGSSRLDATLPSPDGQPNALSQWDGKLVLLNFWASWCAPCVAEMPLLDQAQGRLAARGLQVVGIAADEVAPTRDFLARHPVAYPILVDAPGAGTDLSTRYGNDRSVLPYSVLVGRDGRVLARHFGDFNRASLEAWLAPHL